MRELYVVAIIAWFQSVHNEPRIQRPVGALTAPLCSFVRRDIQPDAYIDSRGSFEVRLQLLSELGETSGFPVWAYLNTTSRRLIFLPKGMPGKYAFKIRVTDVLGAGTIDDNFTVTFSGTPPKTIVMEYEIVFRTLRMPATVESVYVLLTNLKRYFKESEASPTIQVIELNLVPNFGGSVFYQNCTYLTETCPSEDISYARSLIYQNFAADDTTLNSNLRAALLPYQISDFTLRSRGPCALRNAPYPNVFDWPDPGFTSQWLLDACGGNQNLEIPIDLVLDEEDGDTRNLRVRILNGTSNQEEAETSWIKVKSDSATRLKSLSATPMEFVWNLPRTTRKRNPERNVLTYSITFYDQQSLFTKYDIHPVFQSPHVDSPPNDYYSVQCQFVITNVVGSLSYSDQAALFLTGLYRAFGSEYSKSLFIRSYRLDIVLETSTQKGSVEWSLCGLTSPCDFTRVRHVQSAMLISGRPSVAFRNAFNNDFQITAVQEFLRGPCKLNRPELRGGSPQFEIGFCGPFSYRIPENTFFDMEDGFTRNLNLTLLDSGFNRLNLSSWMQFNGSSQTALGLLSSDMFSERMTREIYFPLFVTDSSGLVLESSIRVFIRGSPRTPTFVVNFTGEYRPNIPYRNINAAYRLLTIIGQLTGDEGKSFQLLSHQYSSNNLDMILFSNCSWRESPCDSVNIENFKSMIQGSDNSFSPIFYSLQVGDFPRSTITTRYLSPCPGSPPTVNALWGPLTVSPCQTFSELVPDNTFADVEQGNTRFLRLSISHFDISTRQWIQFEESKQRLTVLVTDSTPSGSIMLIAKDASDRAATQVVDIKVNKQIPTPSHKIAMEVRLLNRTITNFVEAYILLREQIKGYFEDPGNIHTVGFTKLSPFDSQVLTVEWANCSIPSDFCNINSVNYVKSRLLLSGTTFPHPLFILSLQNAFEVLKITVTTEGKCRDFETPPELRSPLKVLDISFCSRLNYQIPSNTFYDLIDGDTRNLALTLRNEDGTELPRNFWLSFKQNSQTIFGAVDSSNPMFATLKQTFRFNLTATTRRGLATSTILRVEYASQRNLQSYVFQLTLLRKNALIIDHAEIWTSTFKKLESVFGIPDSSFYFVSGSHNQDYFVPRCASCSEIVNECDLKFLTRIRNTSKEQNFYGRFQPEFAATSFQEFFTEICKNVSQPVMITRIPAFSVSKCRSFRYQFSKDSFRDENDGTDLNYLITAINGVPIGTTDTWIKVDSQNYVFYGVPVENIIESQHQTNYNVSFRVSNSDEKFIESWTIVTIAGHSASIDTIFHMSLLVTRTDNPDSLQHRIEISDLINSYLKDSSTYLFSFVQQPTQRMSLAWGLCTGSSICAADGRTYVEQISAMLITSTGRVQAAFQRTFEGKYVVSSLNRTIGINCNSARPVPSVNPYSVQLSYCGGFRHKLPDSLFTDAEDGDTRHLAVSVLSKDDKHISEAYPWLWYSSSEKEFAGTPTRTMVLALGVAGVELRLTARDKDLQEVTISMLITFTLPPEPKFVFRFDLLGADFSQIESRFSFMRKLSSYRNDATSASVGYIFIDSARVEYSNCSVSYNPCQWKDLQETFLSFTSTRGIPTSLFKSHMEPQFRVTFVTSSTSEPCPGNLPPEVSRPLPDLTVYLCGVFHYTIPEATFYDAEQGSTSNLQLSFLTSSSNMVDWVSFDSTAKLLSIIPMASLMEPSGATEYTISIVAADSTKLSAKADVRIKFQGPVAILKECQIQVILQSSTSLATVSSFMILRGIVGNLVSYFELTTESEIAIVSFVKLNSTAVRFGWSYCSSSYSESSFNSEFGKVDYYSFATKILMRLLGDDRKTIRPQFRAAFTSFAVTEVKTDFSGRCANFPPIVTPGNERIELTLYHGGSLVRILRRNIFYDFEDGYADSLQVTLLTSTLSHLSLESWINFDLTSLSIYAIMYDDIRMSSQTRYDFILQATDTSGMAARVFITVYKDSKINPYSPFNITYELRYNGPASAVFAIQSHILITQIVTYFSLASPSQVLIRWFIRSNGFPAGRVLYWSIAAQNCTSAVLEKIRFLASITAPRDQQFSSSFPSLFTLTRLHFTTSCVSPPPPVVTEDFQNMSIEFCKLFSYSLPNNLVYDAVNGGISNMAVQLLDVNKTPVSSSSWLQLNTVALKIYGINIQSPFSLQKSYAFYLEVANSGNKLLHQKFYVSLTDTPYISDCSTTVAFTTSQSSTYALDVDILWSFSEWLSAYYGDKTNAVKILSYKREGVLFEVTFSNCSLSFESKAGALLGLDQAHRSRLDAIFSRLVEKSNTPNPAFVEFMSPLFLVRSVTVSYSCLEEPPANVFPIPTMYAYNCYPFEHVIPKAAFLDKRDGDTHQLFLTLHYANTGFRVSLSEWLQVDQERKMVYGVVTEAVIAKEPPGGYQYLLKASDRSGRSANVTYTVKIADKVKQFDAFFLTGFTHTNSNEQATAKILYDIVKRMSEYVIPGDTRLYVKSFQYPSIVQWQHCSLENSCTAEKLATVMQRLQINRRATESFISAMQPSIVPYYSQIMLLNNRCARQPLIQITVNNPPPASSFGVCGLFQYPIPTYLFTDIANRHTRDFLLSVTDMNKFSIESTSWIQFDQTTQTLSGIAMISEARQSLKLFIMASHTFSLTTAESSLEINFVDFDTLSMLSPSICWIRITLEVRYNDDFHDLEIMRIFMSAAAAFLSSSVSEFVFYSYRRFGSNPFLVEITWSNCSLTTLFLQKPQSTEYYSQAASFVSLFANKIEETLVIRRIFLDYLEMNTKFKAVNITIYGSCSQPSNGIPIVQSVPDIIVPTCGEFSFLIPADVFTDGNIGITRQMSLTLLNADRSSLKFNTWIMLNGSQFVVGLPDKQIVLAQPSTGYKFLLRGTTGKGLSAETIITVRLQGSPYPVDKIITNFTASTPITFENELMLKLTILRRFSTYPILLNRNRSFFFRHFSYVPGTPGTIDSQIVDCRSCMDGSAVLMNFKSEPPPLLIQHFLPTLILRSLGPFVSGTSEPCPDELLSPMTPRFLTLQYCGINRLNITADFGSIADQFEVKFMSGTGSELSSSAWAWHNKAAGVFEFFPPEAQWMDSAQTVTDFTYHVIERATGIVIQRTKLQVSFDKTSIESEALDYKFVLQYSNKVGNANAYYISEVITSLETFLGKRSLHFSGFLKRSDAPFQFEVSWKNCSLPQNCDTSATKQVNELLFATKHLGSSYAIQEFFPPTIQIISIENKCVRYAPRLNGPLSMSVPVCGLYVYRFQTDFAVGMNGENIFSMTLRLTFSNGNELPSDSWIRVDNGRKEIYALPTETVVKAVVHDGWKYLLHVTDSKGNSANTTLRVIVQEDIPSYYSTIIKFSDRGNTNAAFIDTQVSFLSLFSEFTLVSKDLSKYRVLSFAQVVKDSYYIDIGHCAISAKLCERQLDAILSTESSLRKSGTSETVSERFSNFMAAHFAVTSVTFERRYSIDYAPKLTGSLEALMLNDCAARNVLLPASLFSDEDGSSFNLTIELLNRDRSTMLSTDWIHMVSNSIYIAPFGDIAPARYSRVVEARDTCGQSQQVTLSVEILTPTRQSIGYEISFYIGIAITGTYPDSYYRYWLWRKLRDALGLTGDSLKIITYSRQASDIRISVGDCSISYNPCNRDAVYNLYRRVFIAPGQPNETIISQLKPEFVVKNVTESYSSLCNQPRPTPCCSSLNVTADICKMLNYRIPISAFSSTITQPALLQYELLDERMSYLPSSFWLQYNAPSRSIVGYPRQIPGALIQRTYRLYLQAIDTNTNTALMPVNIEVLGSLSAINYQVVLRGDITRDISLPDVYHEVDILKSLGGLFRMPELNNIGMERTMNQPRRVQFSFSFCLARTDVCDCNLINFAQGRLRDTESLRRQLGSYLDVQSVSYIRYGECLRTVGPSLKTPILKVWLLPGLPYSSKLPDDQFFDADDGQNTNLTLYLRDAFGNPSTIDWMTIQNNRLCGVLPLIKVQQLGYKEFQEIQLQVVAVDSCGQESVDKFAAVIQTVPKESYYKVILLLKISYSDFRSNCSNAEVFVNAISNYTKVPTRDIVVHSIDPDNSTNGTYISVTCQGLYENSCSNDLYDRCHAAFYQKGSVEIHPAFLEFMRSRYPVVKGSPKLERTSCDECKVWGLKCWVFIILLFLILLLLLFISLWLCWLCVPLYCPVFCGRFFPCCGKCCQGGGTCASTKRGRHPADDDRKKATKRKDGSKSIYDFSKKKKSQHKRLSLPSPPKKPRGSPPPYPDESSSDIATGDFETAEDGQQRRSPRPIMLVPPSYSSHERIGSNGKPESYRQDKNKRDAHHGFGNQYEQRRHVSKVDGTQSVADVNQVDLLELPSTESWRSERKADSEFQGTVQVQEYKQESKGIGNQGQSQLIKYDDRDRQRLERDELTHFDRDAIGSGLRQQRPGSSSSEIIADEAFHEAGRVKVKKPVSIKVPREMAEKYLQHGKRGQVRKLPIDIENVKSLLERGHSRLKIDRQGRILQEDSSELTWDDTHDFNGSQFYYAPGQASSRNPRVGSQVNRGTRQQASNMYLSRSMESLSIVSEESAEGALTISPRKATIRMTKDDLEDSLYGGRKAGGARDGRVNGAYASYNDLRSDPSLDRRRDNRKSRGKSTSRSYRSKQESQT